MPRLIHRLPKYRKHRATGQAVVTLNGKDHYLGPHGTAASKSAYDRLCGEYLASGGALPTNANDELTIKELLAAFYRHAQEFYAPESNEPQKFSTLIRKLRRAYGPTPVREFGPVRMKAFRQTLIDAKLSRTTINQAMNRLRHIFKFGVENELVRPEVLAALKCVAGLRFGKGGAQETEPIHPAPDAAVDATLPYCSPNDTVESSHDSNYRPNRWAFCAQTSSMAERVARSPCNCFSTALARP